jgi:hypothetical protein
MEFGLLPEFSTPVQKPVENAGVLTLGAEFTHILGRFSRAKVRRRRFEAILRAGNENLPRSTGQR